jgi:Secretion system C-terminal sorting domain
MRNLFFTCLLVFTSALNAQMPPDFSLLSGSEMYVTQAVKAGSSYIVSLWDKHDNKFRCRLFKISESGQLVDSLNVTSGTYNHRVWPFEAQNKLFIGGSKNNATIYGTQQTYVAEIDTNLNIIKESAGHSLFPSHGFIIDQQGDGFLLSSAHGFNVLQDTFYAVASYFVTDTPQVIFGRKVIYTKSHFDGTLFEKKEIPCDLKHAFFVDNQLHILGSSGPFPYAFGLFNHKGDYRKGYNFDQFYSGEFPSGAVGGYSGGRYYFSYLANDATLSGCPDRTVTIDVRDASTFQKIHRFKIDQCDYVASGALPYAFAANGDIFFQAAHQTQEKFMVKRFDANFQEIWSREYLFDGIFIFPSQIIATHDGGALLVCYQRTDGIDRVRIFKISADGDILSHTYLPGSSDVTHGDPIFAPNPTSGVTKYIGKAQSELKASIYNTSGYLIGEQNLNQSGLDLSTFPNGMYLITLTDSKVPFWVIESQWLMKASN